MKKTLILIAAMGAVTAAYAQSSVTIYGVLDGGLGHLNTGTSYLTGLPAGLMGNPGVWTAKSVTSSRLGFRGSEDLGGGLRANFSMESRIAPDNGGLQFGQLAFFGGHSWMGLSSKDWGELRLGRQFIPAHYVAVYGDPFGFDYTAASSYGFNKAGSTFTYAANSVSYKTPIFFNGLSSEVVYGLDEGGVAANPINNPNHVIGANVVYATGPLYLGAGFSDVHSATPVKNNFWVVSGGYDLGWIRPIFSVSGSKVNVTTMSHAMTLGATAPVGPGRVKAVYARLDPPGPNNRTDKFGVGYDYFLSKRTNLYVNAGTAKTQNLTRSSGYDFGMKHVF